jgi:uncharacterized protein
MSFTLYDATIPNFRQTIGAAINLLDKADAFCSETGIESCDLVGAKLADDMLPLGYQVKSVRHHSLGAIEGVRAGAFSPDMKPWPTDVAGLKTSLVETLAALEAITPDEVNGFVGNDMAFVMGERRMEFTAQDFLMSFSLPNFYFHAATTYDILRWKGMKIGKLDFMGRPRLKG